MLPGIFSCSILPDTPSRPLLHHISVFVGKHTAEPTVCEEYIHFRPGTSVPFDHTLQFYLHSGACGVQTRVKNSHAHTPPLPLQSRNVNRGQGTTRTAKKAHANTPHTRKGRPHPPHLISLSGGGPPHSSRPHRLNILIQNQPRRCDTTESSRNEKQDPMTRDPRA